MVVPVIPLVAGTVGCLLTLVVVVVICLQTSRQKRTSSNQGKASSDVLASKRKGKSTHETGDVLWVAKASAGAVTTDDKADVESDDGATIIPETEEEENQRHLSFKMEQQQQQQQQRRSTASPSPPPLPPRKAESLSLPKAEPEHNHARKLNSDDIIVRLEEDALNALYAKVVKAGSPRTTRKDQSDSTNEASNESSTDPVDDDEPRLPTRRYTWKMDRPVSMHFTSLLEESSTDAHPDLIRLEPTTHNESVEIHIATSTPHSGTPSKTPTTTFTPHISASSLKHRGIQSHTPDSPFASAKRKAGNKELLARHRLSLSLDKQASHAVASEYVDIEAGLLDSEESEFDDEYAEDGEGLSDAFDSDGSHSVSGSDADGTEAESSYDEEEDEAMRTIRSMIASSLVVPNTSTLTNFSRGYSDATEDSYQLQSLALHDQQDRGSTGSSFTNQKPNRIVGSHSITYGAVPHVLTYHTIDSDESAEDLTFARPKDIYRDECDTSPEEESQQEQPQQQQRPAKSARGSMLRPSAGTSYKRSGSVSFQTSPTFSQPLSPPRSPPRSPARSHTVTYGVRAVDLSFTKLSPQSGLPSVIPLEVPEEDETVDSSAQTSHQPQYSSPASPQKYDLGIASALGLRQQESPERLGGSSSDHSSIRFNTTEQRPNAPARTVTSPPSLYASLMMLRGEPVLTTTTTTNNNAVVVELPPRSSPQQYQRQRSSVKRATSITSADYNNNDQRKDSKELAKALLFMANKSSKISLC